jgi:hypothetical protein
MVRLCERPGCSQPADVGYGIDADRLTVWIQALDPAAPPLPGVLCRRHADAMVVPLRWTLDDRREPVPRLFRAPVTAEPSPKERPRRARPIAAVGTQLALDEDAAAAAVDELDVGAVEATAAAASGAAPWKPVFDPDDDLDGLLTARSPLLSRAFRGTERRRGE